MYTDTNTHGTTDTYNDEQNDQSHNLLQCSLRSHLAEIINARTDWNYWTELNWHGFVFDKLTNGQAVTHYSGHQLITALVIGDYRHVRVSQSEPAEGPPVPLGREEYHAQGPHDKCEKILVFKKYIYNIKWINMWKVYLKWTNPLLFITVQ